MADALRLEWTGSCTEARTMPLRMAAERRTARRNAMTDKMSVDNSRHGWDEGESLGKFESKNGSKGHRAEVGFLVIDKRTLAVLAR